MLDQIVSFWKEPLQFYLGAVDLEEEEDEDEDEFDEEAEEDE